MFTNIQTDRTITSKNNSLTIQTLIKGFSFSLTRRCQDKKCYCGTNKNSLYFNHCVANLSKYKKCIPVTSDQHFATSQQTWLCHSGTNGTPKLIPQWMFLSNVAPFKKEINRLSDLLLRSIVTTKK